MAATLWNGIQLKGWIGLLIQLLLIVNVLGNVNVTIQKVSQTNLKPKVEISNNITSDEPSYTSDYLVSCNSPENEQQVGPAVFSVGSQELCPKTLETGRESYYKIEVTIRFAAYNYSITFEHTSVNDITRIECTLKCAGMSSANLQPFIGQNSTARILWTADSFIGDSWSQEMGCRDASTNQETVSKIRPTTQSVVSTTIRSSTSSEIPSSTDTHNSISKNNQIVIIATSVSASAGLFIMMVVTGVRLYLRFQRKTTKYPASEGLASGDNSYSAERPNTYENLETSTIRQYDSSGYEVVL